MFQELRCAVAVSVQRARNSGETTMKHLAMATAVLSVTAVAALANIDAPTIDNQSSNATIATPASAGSVILAQRRYYRGARRCMERLGYGRTGTYGCG